jgi:hypothetical protein
MTFLAGGNLMRLRKYQLTIVSLMLLFCGLLLVANPAQAQGEGQATPQAKRPIETNLDIQLYMLVGSNTAGEGAKLPSTLDGVLKQLRNALPFTQYRLAGTMLNRTRNGGRLSVRWMGPSMLLTQATPNSVNPAFNELDVGSIKLVEDASGQELVQMVNFNFGTRVPVQAAPSLATNGPAVPVFNYERTGVSTDINLSLGEPAVVGTLSVGAGGEAIILVILAKKASPR